MGTGRDFELIAVSYLSTENLQQLLAPLPEDVSIVVVDNARNTDGARQLVERRPHGRYVDSGGGKGYAKAANLGVRSSTYEYLIFVNPDSRPTLEVFDALVAQLRSDSHLGAVSALMVGSDDRAEIGVGGWEPSVIRAAVHAAGLHKRFPRWGLWARPEPGERIDLDWVSGACMAVRRQTLLDLGGFDERYFVYNEDMTFGRSLRQAGYRQELRTDLLVPHAAGSSGGGSTNMARLRGASMVDYVRRYNSAGAALAIRLLLLIGTAVRIAQSAARRDAPRAAMFRSYAKGLIFGTGRLPGVLDSGVGTSVTGGRRLTRPRAGSGSGAGPFGGDRSQHVEPRSVGPATARPGSDGASSHANRPQQAELSSPLHDRQRQRVHDAQGCDQDGQQ